MPTDRRLAGPRYDLAVVHSYATPSNVRLVTEDCRKDVAAMAWDTSDVARLVRSLSLNEYQGSVWCMASARMWLDGDAYVKKATAFAPLRAIGVSKVFVKIAFPNNMTILAVVSCHP
jgi:hypothetical protein